MTKLTQEQFKQLQEALVDSFSASELQQLVRTGLDENLETISAGEASTSEQAFNLIHWAERHDRIGDLLAAAAAARPGNATIQTLAQQQGDSAPAAQSTAEAKPPPKPGGGGWTIGKIEAVNVGETQTIDQRDSTFVSGDHNVRADRIDNSVIQTGDSSVNTGGGAYVGGNVTTGGDFVGRDKIVDSRSDSASDLSGAFVQLAARFALQASEADSDRAVTLVGDLQHALVRGEDERAADCIGALADLVPGAADTLKQTLAQPPFSERVGPAARYMLGRL